MKNANSKPVLPFVFPISLVPYWLPRRVTGRRGIGFPVPHARPAELPVNEFDFTDFFDLMTKPPYNVTMDAGLRVDRSRTAFAVADCAQVIRSF